MLNHTLLEGKRTVEKRKSVLENPTYRRKRFRNVSLVALLLALAALIYQLCFAATKGSLLRTLSDTCMVPGVICLGIGALLIAKYYGAFYGIAYAIRNTKWLERKRSEDDAAIVEKPMQSFSAYVEQKKQVRSFPDAWLIIGGGLTVLSILFALFV